MNTYDLVYSYTVREKAGIITNLKSENSTNLHEVKKECWGKLQMGTKFIFTSGREIQLKSLPKEQDWIYITIRKKLI